MTLKEKIGDVYVDKSISENLEKIADDYAIEFAEWLDKLTPRQRVSVWSKNGESKGLFNMDNEQLLEIFKKENGL
jgi:hypothetical protein